MPLIQIRRIMKNNAPSRIRTRTTLSLNQLSLPIGLLVHNADHTIRTCKPSQVNSFQDCFFTTQTVGRIEYVGVEPLLVIPNHVCYRYTTYSKKIGASGIEPELPPWKGDVLTIRLSTRYIDTIQPHGNHTILNQLDKPTPVDFIEKWILTIYKSEKWILTIEN